LEEGWPLFIGLKALEGGLVKEGFGRFFLGSLGLKGRSSRELKVALFFGLERVKGSFYLFPKGLNWVGIISYYWETTGILRLVILF